MIVAVDLDGQLTEPDTGYTPEYWTTRKPNYDVIDLLRRIKEKGHKIKIFTSRMSSECKVETIKWLEKYNVPYDSIHFDKPFYDVYFGDKVKTEEEIRRMLDEKGDIVV